MQKTLISSKGTFFYKKIFPLLFLGMMCLSFGGMFYAGSVQPVHAPPPFAFVMPLIMLVVLSIVMKKFILPMADEVYDCGDTLLVKRGSREDRIKLSEIMNVSFSMNQRPPAITLALRQESAFGKEILFMAPRNPSLFKKSPIIDDLIQRVDAARRKA